MARKIKAFIFNPGKTASLSRGATTCGAVSFCSECGLCDFARKNEGKKSSSSQVRLRRVKHRKAVVIARTGRTKQSNKKNK